LLAFPLADGDMKISINALNTRPDAMTFGYAELSVRPQWMLIVLSPGAWCSLVRAFCWQRGRQNLTATVRVCHCHGIEEIPTT
jgi:hypothetical protein